jgi:hypothetical protein
VCAYVHLCSSEARNEDLNVIDLGPYVRGRRRELGPTQAALAAEALVSRRWLSDLEAAKPTAELGPAIKVVQAMGLELSASWLTTGPSSC